METYLLSLILWIIQWLGHLSLRNLEFKVERRIRKLKHRESKHRLARVPYEGRICNICGVQVKGGTKAVHIQKEHPEYGLTTEAHGSQQYHRCRYCSKLMSGSKFIKTHCQLSHP